MSTVSKEASKYVLGVALVVAMIIGGGTRTGLLTDSVTATVVLLASAYALRSPASVPVRGSVAAFLVLMVAAVLLQCVPLPKSILMTFRQPPVSEAVATADSWFAFMSLGLGNTLHVLVTTTALAMFFLAVSRLRSEQVLGLLPFFLVGVICNLIAGAIQFSLSDRVVIDDLLPYRITAGFLGNVNHFSSMLFITIPVLVYLGIIRGSVGAALIGLVSVLLMILAAGSRAGVAIGLMILVASLVFISSRSRAGVGLILAAFAAVSIYSMGAWIRFEAESSTSDDLRFQFVETTWEGIKDNWLVGVGYGNFEKAYQIYEKPEHIFNYVVNHAHNEYVQLVFEGGVFAALLIVVYLSIIHLQLWRYRQDSLRKVAYLAILFLLLHSLVDYPLRTFALLLPFAYFNAILLYPGSFFRKQLHGRVVEIEVDNDGILTPPKPQPGMPHRRRSS